MRKKSSCFVKKSYCQNADFAKTFIFRYFGRKNTHSSPKTVSFLSHFCTNLYFFPKTIDFLKRMLYNINYSAFRVSVSNTKSCFFVKFYGGIHQIYEKYKKTNLFHRNRLFCRTFPFSIRNGFNFFWRLWNVNGGSTRLHIA